MQKVINKINEYSQEEFDKYHLVKEAVVQTMKEVSLTDNDVFRKLFSSKDIRSKQNVIYLTKLILEKEVVDVIVNNCEPDKDQKLDKGIRMDVTVSCIDNYGNPYNVNLEIQKYGSIDSISLRAQLYESRLVTNQVQVGNHKYEFNEVYQVMILDRVMFIKDDMFVHRFRHREDTTNDLLPENRMNIVIVELEKLKNLEMNTYESWDEMQQIGYVLKYAHVENKHDIIKVLEKKNEVLKNMINMKNEFILENIRSMSMLKNFVEECDKEKRVKWAEEYGRNEGREEGIKEGRNDIISKMLSRGMKIEDVALCTGYSVDEINKIVGL